MTGTKSIAMAVVISVKLNSNFCCAVGLRVETALRKLMKNATKEPRIPTARKMAVAKTVPMLVVETLC